jgi:hypothetical protein
MLGNRGHDSIVIIGLGFNHHHHNVIYHALSLLDYKMAISFKAPSAFVQPEPILSEIEFPSCGIVIKNSFVLPEFETPKSELSKILDEFNSDKKKISIVTIKNTFPRIPSAALNGDF